MITANPERDARIKELYLEGKSDEQIAQTIGLTTRSITERRRAMKLRQADPRHYTAEALARIAALAEEGWPITEISETLGIYYESLLRRVDPAIMKRNADAWRGIIRWARHNHPGLFEEIRPRSRKETLWQNRK